MSSARDEMPVKNATATEYGAAEMSCEATRLMQATKNGDPRAFDTLVESLRGRAFQVAHAMVGSRDDAMELCQESFMKVYRARDRFRDGDPFLPWFHRILRNTCFSFLRERKRAHSLSAMGSAIEDDEHDFEIEDDGAAPVDGLLGDERSHAFRAAFAKLSARDREILVLRHFQELSYKEIATSLAIPEGTVMSRLYHARRRLREVLDPALFDGVELRA